MMSENNIESGSNQSNKRHVYIERKGGRILLHAGHQYCVKRKHNSGLVIWECTQRKKLKCNGLIKLQNETTIEEKPHKCSPDFAATELEEQIYKCKMDLVSESYPNVPTTYNNMVARCKDSGLELIQNIPTLAKLKSSLYRYRNSKAGVSKLRCGHVADIEVPPKYQSFLLADYLSSDRKIRILAFASDEARVNMARLDDFLSDGTFKSCPPPFDQLYTIHGDLGSSQSQTNIMPLVYAVMNERSTAAYEILFYLIRIQIPGWNPLTFKTDYEKAAMTAIVNVFPAIVVKGCYFHFRKSVWKKGRELGIDKSKNQSKIREVALSAVLPLLPHAEVINGWNYITRRPTEDPDIKKFREYMTKEWLKPRYIEKWSVFGERHRTTNYLEGWHHKLNSAMTQKAPNIMHFLDELQKDAAFYTVQSVLLQNDAKRKGRSQKSILNDEFIQAAQLEFLDGAITVGHFLEMVKH